MSAVKDEDDRPDGPAGPEHPECDDALDLHRRHIDRIDRTIVALIQERIRIGLELGAAPLPPGSVERIFNEIVAETNASAERASIE